MCAIEKNFNLRGLLFGICLILLIITGCGIKSEKIIVPSDKADFEQVTKINLNILDLKLLKRESVASIEDYDIEGDAKCLYYRYMDRPVVIRIARFNEVELVENFWVEWTEKIQRERKPIYSESNTVKDGAYWKYSSDYELLWAWYTGRWYVSITVPATEGSSVKKDTELLEKIKKVVDDQLKNQ